MQINLKAETKQSTTKIVLCSSNAIIQGSIYPEIVEQKGQAARQAHSGAWQ